jgi:tetratricopeptide (TPR) repeat protein
MSRMELGQYDDARADLEHAMRLAEETGSRGGQAMGYLGLARLAHRTGRFDEAKELAERGYSMLDPAAERVAPHGQATFLSHLSRVYAATGEVEKAQQCGREAVQLALSTEDMPVAAGVLENSIDAMVLAAGNRTAELTAAARALGLAAAIKGTRAIPDADVRRLVDGLRDALGNEAYETAYGEGAALTRADAIAELRKRYSSD